MIIQGSDRPIKIIFDTAPTHVSMSLVNEITEIKHWVEADMTISDDGKEYVAPMTQEESMAFPEGPAWLKIKWNSEADDTQNVQFFTKREYIVPWPDNTVLASIEE